MKNKIDFKTEAFRLFIIIFSTIIYCIGVMWFLNPANIYSGGVTGISQLIVNSWNKFFASKVGFKLNLGTIIFICNIPILIYGWTGVSKRFAIYSVISILLQTLLSSGIIPVPDLGINTGSTKDLLLLSFIGGFICGFGCSLALRYGTSTGGIDVLAQAIAFKKNISIGYMSLMINVIIAILAALLAGNAAPAFYTIVRIIIQSVVTDKVHTSYNYLRVEIVTSIDSDSLTEELLSKIGRGITITKGQGAYTHTDKNVLETYVSSYELQNLIDIAKKSDEHVFITVMPVKAIFGNFKKKTIA